MNGDDVDGDCDVSDEERMDCPALFEDCAESDGEGHSVCAGVDDGGVSVASRSDTVDTMAAVRATEALKRYYELLSGFADDVHTCPRCLERDSNHGTRNPVEACTYCKNDEKGLSSVFLCVIFVLGVQLLNGYCV